MEGHFNFNPDISCEEDKLGFNQYIRTLSGMIKNPDFKTPFCIGVYGKWGSGKTSFMRLLSGEIIKNAKEPYIIPVWFNPWRYEKEEHLIIPFLKTIEKEVKDYIKKHTGIHKKSLKLMKKAVLRIAKVAAAFAYSTSIDLKVVKMDFEKAVKREEELNEKQKEKDMTLGD